MQTVRLPTRPFWPGCLPDDGVLTLPTHSFLANASMRVALDAT